MGRKHTHTLHWFWLVLVVVCTTMFLFVKVFFLCPCMAFNVSVQYNAGLLPDIILLTRNVTTIGELVEMP